MGVGKTGESVVNQPQSGGSEEAIITILFNILQEK
jgi:hypothetical protein